MQVTSPDDQIFNQFATNEKKHIQKKYCKSEVDEYKNISIEIYRSERADQVNNCPDFDPGYNRV